jgi:hypothetical protein
MKIIKIGFMVLFCTFTLWSGIVWADEKDHHDEDLALVPQTGQVISFDLNTPQRDDGALEEGVELPTPRFIDKGNGTIKDHLTGLIWLKNANCPGAARQWQQALDDVASLNKTGKMNSIDCGDTSGKRGSHRTDWRLPNIRELHSLVDFAFIGPAISNAAGTGQGSSSDPFLNFGGPYWSSTTVANSTFAWLVFFAHGIVDGDSKSNFNFVLAVRGDSED